MLPNGAYLARWRTLWDFGMTSIKYDGVEEITLKLWRAEFRARLADETGVDFSDMSDENIDTLAAALIPSDDEVASN